jgi:pyruvate,water dikinase
VTIVNYNTEKIPALSVPIHHFFTHSAIVPRELGIPAVVGCSNATQRHKTGGRVRVDGGRGTVEILE